MVLSRKACFVRMSKIINPVFEPQSRNNFAQVTLALPRLFNETEQKIAAQQEKAWFFSTPNLWIIRVNRPYMSLHFIHGEWELNCICLHTSYFPDDHTGTENSSGSDNSSMILLLFTSINYRINYCILVLNDIYYIHKYT